MVKNLPAIQDTQVWSLDREDPLEKGMATPSNTLAWRIPWTEEPDGLQSMELRWVGPHWVTNTRQEAEPHTQPLTGGTEKMGGVSVSSQGQGASGRHGTLCLAHMKHAPRRCAHRPADGVHSFHAYSELTLPRAAASKNSHLIWMGLQEEETGTQLETSGHFQKMKVAGGPPEPLTSNLVRSLKPKPR